MSWLQNVLSFVSYAGNPVNDPTALRLFASSGQILASRPFATDPPDTEEIVRIRERNPTSFRRRRAPRWKSAARKPPPDRHRAHPARSALGWYLDPGII